MRILHAIVGLNAGGTWVGIRDLVRGLRARCPDIHHELAVLGGGNRVEAARSHFDTVHTLADTAALIALVRQAGYDLLQWWWMGRAYPFRTVLRQLGAARPTTLMLMCQVPAEHRYRLGPVETEHVDYVVTVCRAAEQHPWLAVIPPERRRMIYFGTAKPEMRRSSKRREGEGFVFGRGGALTKIPPGAVGRLAELQIPDAHFRLVGPGSAEQRARIEREAAAAGVADRVEWIDSLPYREWRDFLCGLDVFLYELPPTGYSAIDGVIQDAMLCELPVVLRAPPGPRELVVDGESGLIAASDHEVVAHCRALHEQPELRRRLGAAARQRILEHFSPDKTLAHYQELYRELRSHVPARRRDGRARRMPLAARFDYYRDGLVDLPDRIRTAVHARLPGRRG